VSPPGRRDGSPLGSICVEASPEGGGFTTSEAEPAGPQIPRDHASAIHRLRSTYEDRVARYHQELGSVTTGDPATATTRYPELPVTLDTAETVIIDDELFEHLFDIYVYHGWAGIQRVEDAIARLVPSTPSGGVSDSWWGPAWRFFLFTRNLLAMLIRDAIAELEQRAAARMIRHLSQVAAAVNDAWTARYRITRTERTVIEPYYKAATRARQVVTYSFADTAESKALFGALTQAVNQRVEHEELLQRVARIRDQVQTLRQITRQKQQRGRPLSSERQLTSELDLKEQEQKQLEERSAGLLSAMQAVIMNSSPLGLLVLEGLATGFTQPQMENLLGATLWELYAHLDTLGARIDPGRSQSAALMAEISAAEFDALPERQRALVQLGGPEATVVNAAVMNLPKEPAWLPLLHEQTLHLLLESGEIRRDSFTFVVFTHYVTTLGERLEAERRNEEASQTFWRAFSRVAAAASLVLLVTPVSGVGAVLRGAALVADLVLLAHAVSSVTQQLARIDQLRDQQLLHANAFSVEGLGRLGELGTYRHELLDGITQQLLIELLLIVTGARWPSVKRLLIVRGYLQDVETLLADE
jgi:hypothetical protein